MDNFMQIMTVDFTDQNAKSLFCQSLRETGFGVIKNHPISVDLILKTYSQWQIFFHSTQKFSYTFQKPKQDGYFPFRTENAKQSSISDLKEFYHFYLTGKQPDELKETTLALYHELISMAALLLRWVESALPEEIAAQLTMPLHQMIVDSPNTLLRILHYPPIQSNVEHGAVRAAAHEDINLLTLLPAATAPGLEVLDAHGNWHAVSCDVGSIVVNVGDMLQLCTQDYYRATTHRVVNPLTYLANTSRYSMPLFLHPRPEVLLSKDVTAEVFLNERLRQIGIY